MGTKQSQAMQCMLNKVQSLRAKGYNPKVIDTILKRTLEFYDAQKYAEIIELCW